MQLFRCRVNHAGNRDMAIDKTDVTPAEIVLLKHVHGEDSVTHVEFTREGKRDQREERKRLAELFGAKIFAKVFPGNLPRMPVTLAEAGLSEDGTSEPTTYDPENEAETPAAPEITASIPVPESVRRRAAAAAEATKALT